MKRAQPAFNLYLSLFALSLLLDSGCQTLGGNPRKEITALRLHRVVDPNAGIPSIKTRVYRETPFEINVESNPFLSERDILNAAVVNDLESFFIKLTFNRHGTIVLDTVTTEGKDRRIAIFAQFPESRWLAAPIYNQRINDGVLFFTPDASRSEAERIVRGLNNMAKKLKTKNF